MSKLKKIAKELQKLDGKKIKVGVLSSSGDYPGGQSVVEVAIYNELGVPAKKGAKKGGKWRIPPRPFMRQTEDNNKAALKRVQAGLVRRVINGQATADDVVVHLGEWYRLQIKKTIQTGGFEANAPSTIKRKGSSKPLVDTTKLINSIDWEKV